MGFWFFLLTFIGTTILGGLLRPKPQVSNAKPAGLEDFNFPTASAARPVPVVFGRVMVRGANVMDYGNYRATPITKSQTVRSGFKKKTVTSIVGYRYYITMIFALGHAGIETFHRWRIAERDAFATDRAFNSSAVGVNLPALFGGDDREGGVIGQIRPISGLNEGYFTGEQTLSLIYWDGYIGTSPHLKPWAFEVSRYPSALGYGAIGDDANPIEMIYECMTNTVWGAGIPASEIDVSSFQTAAATCETEGQGLSTQWDSRKLVKEMIVEILRHVDGVLYEEPTTGKFAISLARGGYDVGSLPVFDESNILELENYSRTAWDQTTNEVKVVYNDRARQYRSSTAQAQDVANFQIQGRVVSAQIQYPMFTTASNASKAAWRDLRALTFPLAKATVKINREGHALRPGSVFVFKWPPLEIEEIVMRVTKIRYGTLEHGAITVDCTQDVFSLSDSVFSDPPATGWTEPIELPIPITLQGLAELPYHFTEYTSGWSWWQTADPDLSRLLTLGVKPNQSTLYYDSFTRIGSAEYENRGDFGGMTPSATLRDAYPKNTDYIDEGGSLIIENLVDGNDLADTTDAKILSDIENFFYLDDEILCFTEIVSIGGGEYRLDGVYRGLLDTVPADHAAGARLWFGFYGQGETLDTFEEGQTVEAKLKTYTPLGELDIALASSMSHTITRRAFRPYPPGDTTLNGESWPSDEQDGSLVIAWAHRDRTLQDGATPQSAGDVGPEDDVTYTIRIYDEDDNLIKTVTGETGTSYTYPVADEIADTGIGRANESLRFELEAVRDGYASHQYQEREADFSGYGMHYGDYYGGV